MARETDISGQSYGRLTAIERDFSNSPPIRWWFLCECSKRKSLNKESVTRGRVRSCGCLHLERCRAGANPLRHGHARAGKVSRLHNIWRGMLKRIDSKIGYAYQKYAARGIAICAEWRKFEAFRDWSMANGYADNLTIDRRNNDGDYEPLNCQWVTKIVQARNRRSSHRVTAFGETLVLAEWSERFGIRAETIKERLALGWSPEDAVSKPLWRRGDPRVKRTG